MHTPMRSFLMAVVFMACAAASWPTMEGARPCLGKGCLPPQRTVKQPRRNAPSRRKAVQVSEPVMSVFGVGETAASGGGAATRKPSSSSSSSARKASSRNTKRKATTASLRQALQGAGLQ